jgi:hypothetical protein
MTINGPANMGVVRHFAFDLVRALKRQATPQNQTQ